MKNFASLLFVALAVSVQAQQRLPQYPGFNIATEERPKLNQSVKLARFDGGWTSESVLVYRNDAGYVAFDPKTGAESEWTQQAPPRAQGNPGFAAPPRGRQFLERTSPDGSFKVVYRDGNLYKVVGDASEGITTEGNLAKGIKYGNASWVYGEELGQRDAFGFSPDGSKLWYYRFDESKVPTYYVLVSQLAHQNALYPEAYPKPGQPNPVVEVHVYDFATKQSTRVQTHSSPDPNGMGHYVFHIDWWQNGQLRLKRADRRQQSIELCSADPKTGLVKVLAKDMNLAGWVEADWPLIEVEPGRALWVTETNGYANYVWVDVNNGGTTPLTNLLAEVREIVRIDKEAQKIFYTALDGERSGARQLHVVDFSGKNDKRITDPKFNNSYTLSPNGQYAVVTSQSDSMPPTVSLVDLNGKVIRTLAKSDVSGLKSTGYREPKSFTFPGGDGQTILHGRLHYPFNFKEGQKYPLIMPVYGGPLGAMSTGWAPRYELSDQLTDYGFFVLEIENRGTGGRGRSFRNPMYRNMGIVEIDDMAAAVRFAAQTPGVDSSKVGITGTSYGGYSSLMAILRYPELFHAAVSSSCVSDWRNYDTTYTERYMDLLENNVDGYNKGSAMTYAQNLKGDLLIYYGTADDNTHPSNSLMAISALQRARKTFEVQVGPDQGHSGVNQQRMIEFFIESLILPDRLP